MLIYLIQILSGKGIIIDILQRRKLSPRKLSDLSTVIKVVSDKGKI